MVGGQVSVNWGADHVTGVGREAPGFDAIDEARVFAFGRRMTVVRTLEAMEEEMKTKVPIAS